MTDRERALASLLVVLGNLETEGCILLAIDDTRWLQTAIRALKQPTASEALRPEPSPASTPTSLTALLRDIKQTLCVSSAEYVPAIADAMLLLDKAIQRSYQTDASWLATPSPSQGGGEEKSK